MFLWKRYVDDIYLIAKQKDLTELLEKAYSIRPPIQFTIENETGCKLPFLDILIERIEKVTVQEILTGVYRKTMFFGKF